MVIHIHHGKFSKGCNSLTMFFITGALVVLPTMFPASNHLRQASRRTIHTTGSASHSHYHHNSHGDDDKNDAHGLSSTFNSASANADILFVHDQGNDKDFHPKGPPPPLRSESSHKLEMIAELPKLNFITLSYNFNPERVMIDHNCALLSNTGHNYTITTDNTNGSFCRVCNCVRFVPTGCECPEPGRYDCTLCEKLAWMIKMIETFESFVFLDSDVIILDERFGDMLSARAQHVDFLAAYGFKRYENWRYLSMFNSGLMFMRRLPEINYTSMMDLMMELKTNNDQNVISNFVLRHYHNWDTLSLKWHCRYLFRPEHDIPLGHCLAFHGRLKSFRGALATDRNRSLQEGNKNKNNESAAYKPIDFQWLTTATDTGGHGQ